MASSLVGAAATAGGGGGGAQDSQALSQAAVGFKTFLLDSFARDESFQTLISDSLVKVASGAGGEPA